jgi:hypothetical protein
MTSPDTSSAERSLRLLRRIARGMERRHAIEGAARIEIDKQILEAVDELADAERQVPVDVIGDPPPRAVAVALATAIFAQPHLSMLFSELHTDATEEVEPAPLSSGDAPFVLPPEVLPEALGLPNWELEDIREDVDRKVGLVLKQARAVRWLWAHFGIPDSSAEQLFRVLFPAAPGKLSPVGLMRRGPQLYALASQEVTPPVESLYLSWLPVVEEKSFPPLRTFRAIYVNPNLRRSLGRSIGAADEEVVQILESMVTVIPRGATTKFLQHDGWRARGFAAITGVPAPYGEPAWLSRALEPEDVAWGSWLFAKPEGGLEVGDARHAFDMLAVTRVNGVLRQLYGEMFARLLHGEANGRGGDLILLDVERHIRAVLKPLVAWAEAPQTSGWIAAQLRIPSEVVQRAMDKVAAEWKEQLDLAWVGAPADGHGRTVQALITTHLVVLQDGLRSAMARRADPRGPHKDILLLFAAQYFAHAPLERLWAEASENNTWPSVRVSVTDVVGQWFWGAWTRVLDAMQDEITAP